MTDVIVYSSGHCSYCMMAKQLLERKGVDYTEIRVDKDPSKRDEMIAKSRQRTVPQIFIHDKAIGGYADLAALERANQLDDLLAQA